MSTFLRPSISTLFLAVFLFQNALAQPVQLPDLDWVYEMPSKGTVDVWDVALDSLGNAYTASSYSQPYQPPGLSVKYPYANRMGCAISCVDANGKTVWSFPIVGGGAVWVMDVFLTSDGDLLISGSCAGETYFGDARKRPKKSDYPPSIYTRSASAFLARYSTDGALKWVRKFQSPWAVGGAVGNYSDGRLVWSVTHMGNLSQDGKTLVQHDFKTQGRYQTSLLVLASDGTYSDALPVKTSVESYMSYNTFSFSISQHDELTLFGLFSGYLQLDVQTRLETPTMNYRDGFVARYTPSGSLQWYTCLGGYHDQRVTDVVVAGDGSCYFTGNYTFELRAHHNGIAAAQEPYPIRSGDHFMYGKLSPAGTVEFLVQSADEGPGSSIRANAIELDGTGRAHILGNFSGPMVLTEGAPKLQARYHDELPFMAVWSEDTLKAVSQPFENEAGWGLGLKLEIVQQRYVAVGYHHREQRITLGNGRSASVSSPDSHRNSWLLAGTLPAIKQRPPTPRDSANAVAMVACQAPSLRVDSLPKLELIAAVDTMLPLASWSDSLFMPICSINPAASVVSPTLALAATPAVAIKLFPNPSRNYTTLELAGLTGEVELTLTTASGTVLETRTVELSDGGTSQRFDLSAHAAGLYLITVRQGRLRKVLRLSKVD